MDLRKLYKVGGNYPDEEEEDRGGSGRDQGVDGGGLGGGKYGTRYDDAIDKFSKGKGGINKEWFGLRDDDEESRRGLTPDLRVRVRIV